VSGNNYSLSTYSDFSIQNIPLQYTSHFGNVHGIYVFNDTKSGYLDDSEFLERTNALIYAQNKTKLQSLPLSVMQRPYIDDVGMMAFNKTIQINSQGATSVKKVYYPSFYIENTQSVVDWGDNHVLNPNLSQGIYHYSERVDIYKDILYALVIPEYGSQDPNDDQIFKNFEAQFDAQYGHEFTESVNYTIDYLNDHPQILYVEQGAEIFLEYFNLLLQQKIVNLVNQGIVPSGHFNFLKWTSAAKSALGDVFGVVSIVKSGMEASMKAILVNAYSAGLSQQRLEVLNYMVSSGRYHPGLVHYDPAFIDAMAILNDEFSDYEETFWFEVAGDVFTNADFWVSTGSFAASKAIAYIFQSAATGVSLYSITPVMATYWAWEQLANENDCTQRMSLATQMEKAFIEMVDPQASNDYQELLLQLYLEEWRIYLSYYLYGNYGTRMHENNWLLGSLEWINQLLRSEGSYSAFDDVRDILQSFEASRKANYINYHAPLFFLTSYQIAGRLPWVLGLLQNYPGIIDPSLSGGTVNRTSGTTADQFYFSVDYKDPSGVQPQEIKLHLGSYVYQMGFESGDIVDGARYSISLQITTPGEYGFYFTAKDSEGKETPPFYPDSGADAITVVQYTVPPEEKYLIVPELQTSYYQNETEYFVIKTSPVAPGITVTASVNNTSLAVITVGNNGITDQRGYAYGTLTMKNPGNLTLTISSPGYPPVTRTMTVLASGNDDFVRFEPDYNGIQDGKTSYTIEFVLNIEENTYRNYTFRTNNGTWSNGLQEKTSYQGKSPEETLYVDNYILTDLTLEFDGKSYKFRFFPQVEANLHPIKLIKKIKTQNGKGFGFGWRVKDGLRELIYSDWDYLKKMDHNYNSVLTSVEYDPFYSLTVSPDNQTFIATTYEKIYKYSCDNFQLLGSVNYMDVDYHLSTYNTGGDKFVVVSWEQATASVFTSSLTKLFNFAPIADQCRDIVINPKNNDILLALDNDVNEFQIYSSSGVLKKAISIEEDLGEANSVGISPLATSVVVLDDDNKCMQFFDGLYNPFYSTTLLGETPIKCEWNPNPLFNYLAVTTSTTLYILDMDQYGKIFSKTPYKHLSQNYTDLKWSSDGKVLAISNSDTLYLFSPFDTNPPVITHSLLSDDITTESASLNLGINLSDEHNILRSQLIINGETFNYSNETSIEKSILLNIGSNTITITSDDEFLNQSRREILIEYQPVELKADFKASSTYLYPGNAVVFTNLCTGHPSTFLWDFGDGTPESVLANPSHTYNVPGVYTVSLTVSGETGSDTEVKTDYIFITDFKPGPPTAIHPTTITPEGFFAQWSPVTDATGYEIEVSLDESFTTFLSEAYSGFDAGNQVTLFVETSMDGPFYYRVRAYNSGGLSDYSNTITVMSVINLQGSVLWDINRMDNGTVDGTGTNAGGTLYINLIDDLHLVTAVTAVNPDGGFLFTEITPGSYTLQLTTIPGTPGSPPPFSEMPKNWVYTGEFIGTGAGSDGMADGLLILSSEESDHNGELKFGIVKVADMTTTVTTTPNVINGMTSFTIIVKVAELNQADTYGPVVLAIPKDSRWTLDGLYDQGLGAIENTALNNGDWVYSSDENVHRFSHPLVIPGGTFTTFAFKAIFQPGSTRGVFTITAQIISGSGGETQLSNGSDSEKLDYFSE